MNGQGILFTIDQLGTEVANLREENTALRAEVARLSAATSDQPPS